MGSGTPICARPSDADPEIVATFEEKEGELASVVPRNRGHTLEGRLLIPTLGVVECDEAVVVGVVAIELSFE